MLRECSSNIMCHVSCGIDHVSRVTGHLSFFFYMSLKKLDKVVELVVGGSVINGAYPV